MHFDTLRHISANLRPSTQLSSDNNELLANNDSPESINKRSHENEDGLLPMIQMMFGTSTRAQAHIPEPLREPIILPHPEESEPNVSRPYDLRPRRRVVHSK